MNWQLFTSTFALVFVTELPDKTAFATLLMATRGNPYAIFIGAALAFIIQSAVAVSFGSVFGLLPQKWVHLLAGVLFLVFAVWAWRRKENDEKDELIKSNVSGHGRFFLTVWKAFLIIFVAEWGDLTQLATASLAAHYRRPFTVFIAATLSLWCVSALAVFAGHRLKHVLHPKVLNRISAVLFGGIGAYFIIHWAIR